MLMVVKDTAFMLMTRAAAAVASPQDLVLCFVLDEGSTIIIDRLSKPF